MDLAFLGADERQIQFDVFGTHQTRDAVEGSLGTQDKGRDFRSFGFE